MPARRSEDPALTPAERAGKGAFEHWDAQRRRDAVPAPFERPLPNRDTAGDAAQVSAPSPSAVEGALACDDVRNEEEAAGGDQATDR